MNSSEGDGVMPIEDALALLRAYKAEQVQRELEESQRLLEEQERLLGRYYD